MSHMPPPLDWDEIPEPPELDFSMPDAPWERDPFPADLFAGNSFDYLPEYDPFEPFTPSASDAVSVPASARRPMTVMKVGVGTMPESSPSNVKVNATVSARLTCTPIPTPAI
ncbi:MAG: hypothetical protein UZ13_03070 [Chloroflexi bacterium OLB13]|nr:MAG: hypothetical protein UZ13_03070 [Chloroflexi bacterium OLB13]